MLGYLKWVGRPTGMPEKRAAATTRELAACRRHSLIGGHGSRFYHQPTRAVRAAEDGTLAIIRALSFAETRFEPVEYLV